mmetsp:Transcript_29790/g.96103  ORF Transcript_29790/g.96103 Transcript_29790/m.96103 type:complete len:92 (+) Transcript_29790:41-316(+)
MRQRPLVAGFFASRPFVSRGLPLVLLVVGGAVVLSEFTSGTVVARDLRVKSQSERGFNLEEEHKAMSKKLFGGSDPSAKELILKRIPRREQ